MLIRSKAPKLSFNPSINEIGYDSYSLNNNIPLYSILNKTYEVCGVEIVFGGGKIDERINGASFFSTNLLRSGIKGLNSNDINIFFEQRGAFVQFQSGLDYNTFSLYCISDKLKEILPLFLRLFNEPIFPEEKLTQLANKKAQEFDINQQKPTYWSSKLLKEALFKSHPYGHVLSKEDIKSITSSDLKNHWTSTALSQIKFITAAGNFNVEFLKSIIQDNLSFHQNKQTSKTDELRLPTKKTLVKKTLKNSQQTSLKIGFQTTSFLSPNHPALSLGNTILGGYFGSRFMQSIREDKGLTYGIGSSIQHLRESSYIQISADIKTGAGNEVIELINVELDKIHNNSIAKEELDKVKNYLIGEYKSSSQTIFDKINKIKFLKIHNLSDSYFANYFDTILSTESKHVQEVLKKHYNPSLFKTVLVE